MKIDWIFVIKNSFYFDITLAIISVIALILFIKYHHKAALLAKDLADSQKKYDSLLNESANQNTNLALANQRNNDLSSLCQKNEQAKEHWQTLATTLERDFSAYKAAGTVREQGLLEKIDYLEKIKEEITLKFKNISSEVVQAQHESFSNEQKNTLMSLLSPFAEQLKSFKAEVVATREESIKNKSSLDAQLNNLTNLNLNLSQDAKNLADALKGSKKLQGNWGECQLSRILEISGLRKGQDYETQESFFTEEKKLYRPDVIVHLPENRDIVIDSKVSLNDYLDAMSSQNDEEQQKSLQKNALAIKSHIDELSAKEYQKLLKDRTLNYVIMFIPVESAYIAALDYDRYIYDYAYKKNIILATPLSLLPTLRTIENLWRIDNQNQNVQKIADLGGKLYDKIASFIDDMNQLDRCLSQANKAYNSAMTKLSGRGGALSQAEKMKSLGAKTNKNINQPLSDNTLLLENNPDQGEENA